MLNESKKLTITTGKKVRYKTMGLEHMTWGEFVEKLSNTVRTSETIEDYLAMPRDLQSETKDCGWYIAGNMPGAERKKSALKDRCAITLDIDHVPQGGLELIEKAYSKYEYVLHSTHKHTPEKPRLRIIFLLENTVKKELYEPVARGVADMFTAVSEIGMDMFDDTTFQPARVMHYPTTSIDGEFIFKHNSGEAIDADTILFLSDIQPEKPETWPKSSRVLELRKANEKAVDPRDKGGVIGAFCKAFDVYTVIDEMIDAYEEGEGGRYTYKGSTSSNGAVVYDGGLFLYSNHESDPVSLKLTNAFDLWRVHTFGEGEEGMKLAIKAASFMDEVKSEIGDAGAGYSAPRGGKAEAHAPRVFQPLEGLSEWTSQLERSEKTGGVVGSVANAHLIFENDEFLSKNVAFNGFTGDTVLLGAMPWHRDGFKADKINGVHFDNVDGHMLKEYIRKTYKAVLSNDNIEHATVVRSNQNYFHPVRDYLESVEKKWDGINRVETLFIDYLGADDNKYTRAIARKTLAAAVARVFEPGIKFDQVLVIEGRQGCRKSTFVHTLAMHWFSDGIHAIGGKESVEAMRGKWLLEIAELSALGKREVEAVKAFVTVQSDRMRPAYARRTEDFPRQCIFIGTTNRKDYLKDVTGNRRWWPIESKKQIDIDELKRNLDMIWAEAVFIYKMGEPLFLEDAETRKIAEQEQEHRMADDIVNDMIEDYLDQEVDPGTDDGGEAIGMLAKRSRVCIRQIVAEVFPHAPAELTRYKNAGDIGAFLRKLGWVPAEEAGCQARYSSKKWGRQRFFVRK